MQKLVLRSCSVALILALAGGAVLFSVPGDSVADRVNTVKAFGAQVGHIYAEVKSLFGDGTGPSNKAAPVKAGNTKPVKSGQVGTAKSQPVKAGTTEPPQPAGQTTAKGETKLGAGEGNATARDKVAKALEQAVFQELNRVRREHKLTEFKWNDQIAEMARLKSIEVMETGLVTHNSAKYGYACDMYRQAGIPFKTGDEVMAENTAPTSETERVAKGTIEAWMNSPPHRRAILNADFREAGVGVAWVSNGVNLEHVDSGHVFKKCTTCTNALFLLSK